eukprot:m.491184 g.491184  ORF g.491184 m.491184 type:complete len:190 (+) comp29422_c0_seq1:367-936(+)
MAASAATARKVFKAAVVVSPPRELWDSIQTIRKEHDKAYERWPPHINILWPFYGHDLEEHAARLGAALGGVKPFRLTLADFAFFKHKSKCSMHCAPVCEPADSLQVLQRALIREYPECDDLCKRGDDGFHPHLTVGQWRDSRAADRAIDGFKRDGWEPIEFTVNEVHLITRDGDTPFEFRHRIPLGGGE